MQAFERELFQQDQGVANMVRIGVRMSRQNLFDAGRQSNRRAPSLRRTGCWRALTHVDGGRLPSREGIVTVVPKQRIDRRCARHLKVLKERSDGRLRNDAAATERDSSSRSSFASKEIVASDSVTP